MVAKKNRKASKGYYAPCLVCKDLTSHGSGKCKVCRKGKPLHSKKPVVGVCSLFQIAGEREIKTDGERRHDKY